MIVRRAYFLIYGFVFTGWLFHRSLQPTFLAYSTSYILFLLAALLPFFVPFILEWIRHWLGQKRFSFVVVTVSGLAFLTYLVASFVYYQTRSYPFDPFLQVQSPTFSKFAGEKRPGLRILTLGSSAMQRGFPQKMQSVLSQKFPHKSIELINLAAPWYTTKHSLILYSVYAQAWNPDIVVISHAGNDLYRTFSPPDYALGPYKDTWGHFYGPSIHGAKPPSFESYLFKKYLERYVDRWFSRLRFREVDYPPTYYKSLEPFEKHLETLVFQVMQDGATPLLVTPPTLYSEESSVDELAVLDGRQMFCNTKTGFLQEEYPSTASIFHAMERFHEAIRRVGKKYNCPVVDAAQEFPQNLEYFTDAMHYTLKGDLLMVDLLMDALLSKGVIATISGEGTP